MKERALRTFLYRAGQGLSRDLSLEELARHAGQHGAVFWIDLEACEAEEIKRLGELFGFHPLAVEDAITLQQRAKIDLYENVVFIVLRDPEVDRILKGLKALELDFFLGPNFLVTIHAEPMECIDNALNKIQNGAERLLGRGPDFLAHAIIDRLIDDHLQVLDWLDGETEQVEATIFQRPDRAVLERIADLNKNILYIQRVLGPQLEVMKRLSWEEMPFINPSLRPYFRDVYDSLARINDIIVNYRAIVASQRDMYLSAISNRMNEIMKTLTIIATIMLPLTFITGIFGMNFAYIPGLQWKYGFFAIAGLMALLAAWMLYYFKRRGWFD